MLSIHLPITQLSPGSTIFCLHAKIIFLSVLIPLTLSALMLICKVIYHCTLTHLQSTHSVHIHSPTQYQI